MWGAKHVYKAVVLTCSLPNPFFYSSSPVAPCLWHSGPEPELPGAHCQAVQSFQAGVKPLPQASPSLQLSTSWSAKDNGGGSLALDLPNALVWPRGQQPWLSWPLWLSWPCLGAASSWVLEQWLCKEVAALLHPAQGLSAAALQAEPWRNTRAPLGGQAARNVPVATAAKGPQSAVGLVFIPVQSQHTCSSFHKLDRPG